MRKEETLILRIIRWAPTIILIVFAVGTSWVVYRWSTMSPKRRIISAVTLLMLLALLLGTGCVPPYTRDLTSLSRKQAIQDVDYLVKNVKAIHPDPFTRIGEEAFDAHVRRITAALEETTSRKDFSLPIAELLALIRDSHTRLASAPDYEDFVRSGGKTFPLRVQYKDGAVTVAAWAKTVQPERGQVGDSLIAINGKPLSSWLGQYRKYVSAETEHQQTWHMVGNLALLLWHAEGECEFFEVTLKKARGETWSERIPAAAPEFGVDEDTVKLGEFPFVFYLDNQVCLFRAPSFHEAYREKFMAALDSLFSAMKEKGASVLIVDIRGNGGGHGGLPWELLLRTAQKPFKEGSKRWRYSKAYQRAWLIAGLKERGIPSWLHLEKILRLDKYRPVYYGWFEKQGEFLIPKERTVAPYRNNWKGTLVVITDHFTGSAAVDLASITKDNGLAIIAGEETGGRASYFSEIAPVYLPNSGLLCVVASAHWIRPGGYDDGRGVLPDLPLDVTLEDSMLVERIYDHVTNREDAAGTQREP